MSTWRTIDGVLARRLRHGDFAGAWGACEGLLFRGPVEATPESLHCLLTVGELAAQYNSPRRARRWIQRHRDLVRAQLGELTPTLSSAYAAMLYIVESMFRSRIEELEGPDIDWSQTRGHYWAFNLRLRSAVLRRSHRDVTALLRERRRYREDLCLPHARGDTLRLLGLHFYWRGELCKAMEYLHAADRHYRTHPCLPSTLKRVEVLQGRARVAFHDGKLHDAEALYREAFKIARRYHHPAYPNYVREELAGVYTRCGDIDRAKRLVRAVLRETRKAPPRDFPLRATAFLALAELQIAELRLGLARHLIERAVRVLRRCPPREAHSVRGNVHLVRAQIRAQEGTGEKAYRRALREFDRAEQAFRDADNLLGAYRLFVHRGHLRIRHRDINGALREVMNCLDLWRKRGFVPAKGAALLLKSQLLLQEETSDSESLYEEVLRDRTSVHNPLILFRVVANLYLYTWHLSSGLELSDTHLAQIHELKDLFDRRTFVRLYERYVTTGVFSQLGFDLRPPPDIV